MTLICLFQVLLYDLDIESLHGKIFVMYFGHFFPLTSHIRGHLLYYETTLLHPSTDTKYVSAQKENVDWSGLNTIDGHDLWWIFLRLDLYIFIMNFGLHMRLCALQPAYTCIREFPLSNSHVIREFRILIPVYTLIQH